MTTATVPPEVEAYLGSVRAALGDLPSDERDDLLAEVEASLVDASAEGGSLTARLGPPEEFAAELRSAAGLHEPAPAPPATSELAAAVRRVTRRLAAHPAAAVAGRVGSELAPIWWVARGYLAVGLLAIVFDTGWSFRVPVVPMIGDAAAIGLAVIGFAVLASVALGLLFRRHGSPFPRLAAAANVALLLVAIPVAADAARAADAYNMLAAALPTPVPASALPDGLAYDGVPVDNVYPYSRGGKLLHDVLLYDGAGRPLEIGGDRALDPNRRYVVTNGNKPLFNVFPIRYYEPGTKRVARPNAAPYVELPLVLTPPLPGRAGR